MTPTRSDLGELRAGVLRRPAVVGADLRRALVEVYDRWLAELVASLGKSDGFALVAVGGYGRREASPYSDLDLVLLHDGKVDDLTRIADSIWYPIWDSGISLDHSVRTPDQALAVAKDDLKALLGLLDVRHVAGDCAVSAALRTRVLDLWRATAGRRVDELHDLARARWERAGEGAFLLEPNLKESRGGLRDAQSLRALALAQLADVPVSARAATEALLDVRGELHRRLGREADVLRQQEQAGIATNLGLADADAVLRTVNEAARTISLALDTALRRVAATRPARGLSRLRRPKGPQRVGLARDVVAQDGEVVLARDADPWADPVLVLRAARAAAEHQLPLAEFTLERLASESAPLPVPWPAAARDEFETLLGAGPRAVPVLESLDEAGLLVRLIPEWDAVRFKAQHNPVHRYTVDRHLLETAAQAASLRRKVARPDLLLLGGLLHDIGKGSATTDHSEVGAQIAQPIVSRMGLSFGDAATVVALVRHHLLLPDTATRRDLDDPMTIATVTDAVAGSVELLDLLYALTIADARATSPLVWTDWKAGLVADLVARARRVLHGAGLPPAAPLDERRRELAEAGEVAVEIRGDEVLVAAPDRVGVLYRTAGVLALHSLDVRSASIRTHAGTAVNAFVVEPRFGTMPDPRTIRADLLRALDGKLGIAEKLEAKERAYSRGSLDRPPPEVLWFDDAATEATVVELRTDDAIGLLFRITRALEQCGLDVRSARLSSVGGAVVDAFYVTGHDGRPVPAAARAGIERQLTKL